MDLVDDFPGTLVKVFELTLPLFEGKCIICFLVNAYYFRLKFMT